MTRRLGYDDPTIAADVEAAYDAEAVRDLRLLESREKWERRGREFGRFLVAIVYVILFVAAVNLVHAFAWGTAWIWGWWG